MLVDELEEEEEEEEEIEPEEELEEEEIDDDYEKYDEGEDEELLKRLEAKYGKLGRGNSSLSTLSNIFLRFSPKQDLTEYVR